VSYTRDGATGWYRTDEWPTRICTRADHTYVNHPLPSSRP
jgi:hypothetical protein